MSASRRVQAERTRLGTIVGLCLIVQTLSYGFAGGTGEPNDPYRIATAKDLLSIGSDANLLSRHYLLVADIDLTAHVSATAIVAPDTDGKTGFDGAAFTGVFNGQGHRISGVTIDASKTGNDYLGLFGRIGAEGKVLYLGVEEAVLSGGRSALNLGALAGDNSGLVYQCYATGLISGSDYLDKVGGLVGSNDGVVGRSYAMVDLSAGQFSNLAGLIGSNTGVLSECYAAGAVSRSKFGTAAGLVVSNTGLLLQGYFLSEADGGGPDNGNGIALSDAQMKDASSFTGFDFSGKAGDGRLEAWVMPEHAYPVLAWQTDLTKLVWAPEVRGMSLDEARAKLAAAGLVVSKVVRDFDSLVPVDKVVLVTPAYPVAKGTAVTVLVSEGAYDWQQNPGKGTKESPYRIGSAGQLEAMGRTSAMWSKYFVLTDSIDLTGRLYHDAVIAAYPNQGNVTFNGGLDGVGFEITGLTIASARDYVGLLGYVGSSWQGSGEIRNVVLADAYVLARSATDTGSTGGAAILAGQNSGTVADCTCDGAVLGLRKVGGLVGRNAGTITRCMSDAAVLGKEYLGGLAGYTYSGGISLSYVTGDIEGLGNNIGGLVGYVTSGTAINQCFAVGNVSGFDYAGGLVGYAYSGTINECFAGGSVSGNDSVGGLAGYSDAAIKKSCATGAVSGRNRVGGLVGHSDDAITQCYATGDTSGNENVGGLAGYAAGYSVTIGECYAAGAVLGTKAVGGLIGYKYYTSTTVTKCFWDATTSGIAEGAFGTPLPTAQMQAAQTFLDAGWDFSQTWMICEGKDYPRFQWEAIECE